MQNFPMRKQLYNAINVFCSRFLTVYGVCLYFNNAYHLHEGKTMLVTLMSQSY